MTPVDRGSPVTLVIVPEVGVPRTIPAPKLVSEEDVTPDARDDPVSVPAGAMTALVPAAVTRPLPLTVKLGMAVLDPNDPTLLFTVARVVASVPLVVRSPVRSPLVTAVDPENLARLPEAGDPDVVTVPALPAAHCGLAEAPCVCRKKPLVLGASTDQAEAPR